MYSTAPSGLTQRLEAQLDALRQCSAAECRTAERDQPESSQPESGQPESN
jgi:hypothetical protein